MSETPMQAAAQPRVIKQLFMLLLVLVLAACSRGGTGVPPVEDDHSTDSIQVLGYTGSGDTVTISAEAATSSEKIGIGSGTISASGQFSWELQEPPAAALLSWEDALYFSTSTPSDTAVRLAFAEHFDVDDETNAELALSHSEHPNVPVAGTVHGLLVYADRTAIFTLTDAESGQTAAVTLQAGWNIFAIDYESVAEGFPFQADVVFRVGTLADLYFYYQVPMPG